MPADDARPARDPADDAAQPGPDAHGVHDLGRRPRRRHHRHLGRRPRAHRPGARRLGHRAVGDHPARVTSSRCATARAACWSRRGHTEAAVDLARLAGLTPAGVLVEIVNDDGTMKRAPELRDVRRRARAGDDLDRATWSATGAAPRSWSSGSPRPGCRPGTATSRPTATGSPSTPPSTSRWCTATLDRRCDDGEPVLTRVHSECLTGDVFGIAALRLRSAARRGAGARSSSEGRGVVVYLRGHEGRGIGLVAKLQAYHSRTAAATPSTPTSTSACRPTPATTAPPPRSCATSGSASVRLLTNNPDKVTRASRTTASRGRAGAAHPAPQRPQPRLPAAPSATGWATSCPTWPPSSRPRGGPAVSGRRRARRRSPSTASDLRVAVVAAQLAHRGDGRPARRRPARARGVPPCVEPPMVRVPGHLRAPGRRRGAGAAGLRRRRGARRRHPRRHPALRLRLLRRHRRAHPGRPRPRGRRSASASSPATTTQQALDRAGLEGSHEDKGYEATAAALAHRAHAARPPRRRVGPTLPLSRAEPRPVATAGPATRRRGGHRRRCRPSRGLGAASRLRRASPAASPAAPSRPGRACCPRTRPP